MNRRRTLLGFEFGCLGPLTLRQETVPWDVTSPIRLLYASDLHLGHWWTRPVPQQLAEAAQRAEPNVILLGGDLVDHPAALPQLQDCIRQLATLAPVYAIPGNHDRCVPSSVLARAVVEAGGLWLPDQACTAPVRIEGRITGNADSTPRILCAHEPSIFPTAQAAGYRLILAGHLHGGQCVLATHQERLYPAYWLHRWHVLRHTDQNTLILISRGVADTLPFRFQCPREVLVCDLQPR